VVAWISGILLGICAIPQGLKTYRTKTARDISWMFLGLWLGGELTGIVYAFSLYSAPLVFNYALNTTIIVYILYTKIKEALDA